MSDTKIHYRTDLWYGRYDHCIRIYLHEAPCLRDTSQTRERIQHIIQRRRDWGQRMAKTMSSSPNSKQPGSWYWQSLEITERDEANLLDLLDFLQSTTVDYRKHISGDWMYFYSNDPGFIDSIEALPFLEHRERTQRSRIELQGTPGTVRLQDALYRYRSYLRGYMKLTDQQTSSVQKYLNQITDIRLSPSLAKWCADARKSYIGDYFFIDHDDMGIITMLSIIVPNLIRRTKPIEAAK